MFCPNCKDEFRAGFTRCDGCGVDLVEDLSRVESAAESLDTARAKLPADGPVRVADYCGFFTLDEARASREILRGSGIVSEIAIRDAPAVPGDPSEGIQEEYWLRVDATQMKHASTLLDIEVPDADTDAETLCDKCGKAVASSEKFCGHCGERFDN